MRGSVPTASEKFLELLLPMVDQLEEFMRQNQSPSVALAAVKTIIDLNSLSAARKASHDVEASLGDDLPTDIPALVAMIK